MELDPVPAAPEFPGGAARSLAGLPTSQALNDWLTMHRELIKLESAFTDLAIEAAVGKVSARQLAQERQVLEATRELCSVAYRLAFPGARGAS